MQTHLRLHLHRKTCAQTFACVPQHLDTCTCTRTCTRKCVCRPFLLFASTLGYMHTQSHLHRKTCAQTFFVVCLNTWIHAHAVALAPEGMCTDLFCCLPRHLDACTRTRTCTGRHVHRPVLLFASTLGYMHMHSHLHQKMCVQTFFVVCLNTRIHAHAIALAPEGMCTDLFCCLPQHLDTCTRNRTCTGRHVHRPFLLFASTLGYMHTQSHLQRKACAQTFTCLPRHSETCTRTRTCN